MRIKRTGFTLVELLIIIVVLVILASLVVPRMLAQPERARVAEAINYLGLIRRTQETMVGIQQGSWISGTCSAGTAGDTGWKDMGMAGVPAGSFFDYACTAGAYDSGTDTSTVGDPGTCSAMRRNVPAGNTKAGSTITMRLYSGTITACGGEYRMLGATGNRGTTCG